MTQAAEAATDNVAIRLIDRHVQANLGNRRAFDYADKPYSYHDLAALANRAGNLLKSLGVAPGERVLMLLPGSPAYLATLIGAIKIGAVPVIASATGDEPALRACIDGFSPVIAVVHQNYVEKLGESLAALPPARIVVVGQAPAGHPSFVEGMRAQASSLTPEKMAPEAPCLALAAGGAAGTLSHRDVEALLGDGPDRGLGSLAATLRSLARAEVAQLP